MHDLNLSLAQEISLEIIKISRASALPPLAHVLLDRGGQIKFAVMEDNIGTFRFDIARGKAATALGMGMGTRSLYQLFERDVLPDRFANAINGLSNGQFTPQPGGLLIYKNDNLLGAIGISGASSDDDERVAIMACERSGLKTSN